MLSSKAVLFMSTVYRVKAFAALAGVTVKTLHHYDRLGLLRARRTSSGYRAYSDRDLQRIEEIAALKLIGVPLKEVARVLAGETRALAEILESQRRALYARRAVVDRTIAAIESAQQARGSRDAADADVLRRLIEAMEMQNSVDVLKVYFDDEAWARWRAQHDEWPGAEWEALLREIEASLGLDPASLEAGALAERWNDLAKREADGDPRARVALMKAWRSWMTRPESRPPQLAAFAMDRILPFVVNAADAVWERRRLASPETARVPPRVSPSRLALFKDVVKALETDPASDVGRALAKRYDELLETEAAGDAAAKAEMREAWTYRRSWPSGVLRWIASTYDLAPETWVAAAEYLRRASDAYA
jgi:DNA-binding transcriptional MerR regulator